MNSTQQLGWEHVRNALTLLIPVMIMLYQLQRNYKNTLRLQEQQLKRQMALEIYREFSSAWERAITDIGGFGSNVRSIQSYVNLSIQPAFQDFGIEPPLLVDMRDTAESMGAAADAFAKLTTVMEKYEVALPGFRSMRDAIFDQFRAVNSGFVKHSSEYYKWIPSKDFKEKYPDLKWKPPSNEVAQTLDARTEEWLDLHADLLAYLWDLRTEVQNYLVGPFFGHTVPRRQPTDVNLHVLSREAETKTWFTQYKSR